MLDGKDEITIIEGPKNRISEFINLFNREYDDIEKIFGKITNTYAAVFIIYDVDHNSVNAINQMFNKFYDESTGLLLLSSPCLEVLGDFGEVKSIKRPFKCKRVKEYKKKLNIYYNTVVKCNSTINFIIDNFEECALYYLDKNFKEFNCSNIMEHPELVKDKINDENIRSDSELEFRYFTTVVYVCVSYILGLTKQIENYDIVRKYFEESNRKVKEKQR